MMPSMLESPEQRRWRVLALLVPHVCHKLNNAIGVIQGLTELVARRSSDERSRKHLDTVFEQSGVATQLVNRLGDYAVSLDAGSNLVDLEGVVADAKRLLEPLFQVTGGELQLVHERGACVADVDARRLLQVLVTTICSPWIPPVESDLAWERTAATVRLSLLPTGRGVALRVTHLDADRTREEVTAQVVAPLVEKLGGAHRLRSLGTCCCHRFAL
jgi:hypothetical protein